MAQNSVEYVLTLKDLFSAQLKRAADEAKKMEDGMGSLQSKLMQLGAGLGIAALGKQILDIGVQFDNMRVQFDVMLGSAEAGGEMLRQIKEMAASTPLETKDLVQAGTTLLNFGVIADEIIPTLGHIGDVAGGNAERFQRLSLAFGQVSSAGKMQGQDLLQMIDAGFNPLQIIAEKTGKSMADLKDEMSDGKISAAMIADAFKTATGEGGKFHGMMDKMSQTVGGRISTMMDEITMLALSIYESLKPAIGAVIEGIIDFIGWIRENSDWLLALAAGIGTVVLAWGAFHAAAALSAWWTGLSTTAIILNTLVTEGWTAAQLALNMAMKQNPFGWIAMLIGVVVAAVVYCWNTFEGFRAFLYGLWASIVEIFKGIGDIIWGTLTGDFGAIAEGVEHFKNIGAKFAEGYNEGIKDFREGEADGKGDLKGKNALAAVSAKQKASKSKGLGTSVEGASGSKPTHVYITIQKMIDGGVNIHTTNIKEGSAKLEEMVKRVLLTAVNDTNTIIGQ